MSTPASLILVSCSRASARLSNVRVSISFFGDFFESDMAHQRIDNRRGDCAVSQCTDNQQQVPVLVALDAEKRSWELELRRRRCMRPRSQTFLSYLNAKRVAPRIQKELETWTSRGPRSLPCDRFNSR